MVAAVSLAKYADTHEQRFLLHNVTWKEYVLLREALDTPGLRMTYLKGKLELMSPSRAHEQNKTMVARLVELYAFLMRVPLYGYGSTTFRAEVKERGCEPDECWCIGRDMRDGEFPHIVLEVIEKAPLLDKLDVYDGFEVPEVWIFQQGAFAVWARRKAGGYARALRSGFIPKLDFALLERFALRPDQDAALHEFADRLRARRRAVRRTRTRR